jgi:hypothetical protein
MMILEKAGGVRAMEELGGRTARDPGGGCSLQIENGVALDSPIAQPIYLGTVIVHMSERFGLPCVLYINNMALGVISSQNINICQVTNGSHICSTEIFTKRFKPTICDLQQKQGIPSFLGVVILLAVLWSTKRRASPTSQVRKLLVLVL